MTYCTFPLNPIFVDQFKSEDVWAPPDPTTKYRLVLGTEDNGWSQLMKLILLSKSNPEVMPKVQELCADPKQIEHRTTNGFAPILLAVVFAGSFVRPEIAEWILTTEQSIGSNLDSTIPSMELNLLGFAIVTSRSYSNLEMVTMLLKFGADPNATSDPDKTPILIATRYDDPIVMEMLVQYGANLEIRDKMHRTPLHVAALFGHANACSFLLTHSVDIESPDGNGTTPLITAAINGNVKIIQLLLAAGAKINAQSDNGTTPLIEAVHGGKMEAIRALIDAGADLEATLMDGSTALTRAAFAGQVEIIQSLLAAGAKINAQSDNGTTPLIEAVHGGKMEAIRALIEAGADLEATLTDGTTALMKAAFTGQVEIIQSLLAAGAKIEHTDKNGSTSLMEAAYNGRIEGLKILIAAGANLNHRNSWNRTALTMAGVKGHLEAMRVLIAAGATGTSRELVDSVERRELVTMRGLLEAGVDPNLRDGLGRLASRVAIITDRVECLKVLFQYGVDSAILKTAHGINCRRFAADRKQSRRLLRQSLLDRCLKQCALTGMKVAICRRSYNRDESMVTEIRAIGGQVCDTITSETDIAICAKSTFTLQPRQKPLIVTTWSDFQATYLK